jgi:hypothetical protein
MKITLVAAALFATVFWAGAQEQRLNLPSAQMTVSEILSQIREQTNLGVAYRTDQIQPQRVVNLPSQDVSLDQTIGLIAQGTGTRGEIDGAMIVFRREPSVATAVPSDPEPVRQEEIREPMPSVMQGDQTLVSVPLPNESRPLSAPATPPTRNPLPRFSLKMNLLYLASTLTPNLQFEFGLGRRTSLELSGSYNPWRLKGSMESNRKLVHMVLKPEFRYWLGERFEGHHFGAHAIYARYNIGTYKIPLLFKKEYRYDGYAYGGGVSYGYRWAFAERWGVDFSLGVGVLGLHYDRYDCQACDRNGEPRKKIYFGPTNAAISVSFLIQ